tara:strand:- start:4867 stop:5766 length:900 start_codon:yes stop_codon:yes gene_type:complete
MNTPIISVILPVYNGGEYLNEAIDSILNQTFSDFEFIIINDGSTDDSLSIIESYLNVDDRITLINRENKGLIASLNEGINLSRGKYIARMDADDVSFNTRFAKQLKLLDSGYDICGCHFITIDIDGKKVDSTLVPLEISSMLLNLSLTVPFAHGSIMVRRSFLDIHKLKYGGRSAKSAEDYDLWVEMYNKGARFANVDDFLFYYRWYALSVSKINSNNLKADAQKLSLKMFQTHSVQIENAINQSMKLSLTEEEKDLTIGCALYLLRYKKSLVIFSVIKLLPAKNVTTIFFKFLTGRFF